MATKGRGGGGEDGARLPIDPPRPVYLIDGEERYLVDEALAQLRDVVLPGRARDFNLDLFMAKEVPLARIIDAANTLPAFAPTRLVLVKEAEALADLDDLGPLTRYVASPSPSTVLVLVASEKFDARTRFYKALERQTTAVRFSKPSERDLPRVIEDRARRAGLTLDAEAVRALADGVGCDVGAVVAALEKLALYVGDRRRVARADVEELVVPAKEESIFDFADAVGTRDAPRALALLHGMLVISKAHPLQLLGLLAGHWRKLATVRALVDARAGEDAFSAALPRLPPFVVQKLRQQASRQSAAELVNGLEAIQETDKALKGGRLADTRVMERLVLTLVGGLRAAAAPRR
jgi:DNA polymerase-3 subunit delta